MALLAQFTILVANSCSARRIRNTPFSTISGIPMWRLLKGSSRNSTPCQEASPAFWNAACSRFYSHFDINSTNAFPFTSQIKYIPSPYSLYSPGSHNWSSIGGIFLLKSWSALDVDYHFFKVYESLAFSPNISYKVTVYESSGKLAETFRYQKQLKRMCNIRSLLYASGG